MRGVHRARRFFIFVEFRIESATITYGDYNSKILT